MNKIIREHYPASKLPEDLRKAFPVDSRVRVTVEAERARSFREIKQEIDKARARENWPAVSREEAIARIRTLRDEWD